jgi:hypothetical protein
MSDTTTMNDTDADVVVVESGVGDSSSSGIPAGYFLKPDPVLTRVETRHYLMGELARYLKGSLLTDAVAALEVVPVGPVAGPAGRMVHLYRLLQGDGKLPEGSVAEQMAHVGRWIFSVIQASVTVGLPSAVTEYETLALAFWNEDLLPGGRTIGSYWDYSPFEALRTAPPLTTTEDSATVAALPASPSAEPEDDMPGLISLEDIARQAADTGGPAADDDDDYSDMPPLIPISSADTIQQVPAEDVGNEDEGEEEEYVAYSTLPELPKSLEDCIGGAVESLMNFALRPVTIPVWGIALALAILPPLLMSKC